MLRIAIVAALALGGLACRAEIDASGPAQPPPASWTAHIERLDRALAEENVRAADRAWHAAYFAALGSRHWAGMVDVGDAALRLGQVARARRDARVGKLAEPRARDAYRLALARARDQQAPAGVLRAAEAFAALGDREAAEQARHLAVRTVDYNRQRSGTQPVQP
jgi:hypothetical protein